MLIQSPKSNIPIGANQGGQVKTDDEFVRFFESLAGYVQTLWDRASSSADQTSTPADGSTVLMTSDLRDGFLRVQGAAPLANLAITHPTGINGQVRAVYFEVDIAAITWPGSTATNLPTSAVSGDSITTQRLEAGLWVKRD